MEHVQPWQVLRVIAVIDSPGTEYFSLRPHLFDATKPLKHDTKCYVLLTELYRDLCWSAAVSTWMSKTARICFGFILSRYHWLKNLAPLFHPTVYQKWNQNQSWLARARFPALCVSVVYRVRVLIGSLYCLCLLWLARVISLTLILRHSNENLCIVSDWVLNCPKRC